MFFLKTDIEDDWKKRFDSARFTEFLYDEYDQLNSYLYREIKKLPSGGYFRISEEEGKPDLISYRIYGSTEFWWIIMYYNGLMLPEELKSDFEIQYPKHSDLENLFFSLKAKKEGIW